MSYQREYERRLEVGIIGAGSHCYRNILPLMTYLPVHIAAICDVNGDLAAKTAAQYGCRSYISSSEMYDNEKLDGVFISVGPQFHPALVLEAFSHDVNVWVEKPIAVHSCQVEEMIAARKNLIAVVGLKKAFSPACSKMEEIVDHFGGFDSILGIYPMSLVNDSELPNWLRNGVHPLSFMMQIGGKVHSVRSVINRKGKGDVILQFENGSIGTLHLATGPKPDFEMYEIYGDGWRARVDESEVSLDRGIPFDYKYTTDYIPSGYDFGRISWKPGNCVATLENKSLFTQGFYNEAMYFCQCVLDKQQPVKGTLEFALEIMKVYEAAFRSEGEEVIV